MLDELAVQCHNIAVAHGFWEDCENPIDPVWALSRCMLITTEVAELAEEFRKLDFDLNPVAEEMADIIIRVMDMATSIGVSLDMAVEAKMKKNRNRPYKHGKQA